MLGGKFNFEAKGRVCTDLGKYSLMEKKAEKQGQGFIPRDTAVREIQNSDTFPGVDIVNGEGNQKVQKSGKQSIVELNRHSTSHLSDPNAIMKLLTGHMGLLQKLKN